MTHTGGQRWHVRTPAVAAIVVIVIVVDHHGSRRRIVIVVVVIVNCRNSTYTQQVWHVTGASRCKQEQSRLRKALNEPRRPRKCWASSLSCIHRYQDANHGPERYATRRVLGGQLDTHMFHSRSCCLQRDHTGVSTAMSGA